MRRWVAVAAALIVAGWSAVLAAPTAAAASEDAFDRFDVVAVVDEQGNVDVTETIVLRFGSSSGRHGLERTLITREPDGDEHDVVYKIDNVSVTSPDEISTQLDLSDQGSGRNTHLRIRVGSADRVITAPTATYVLKYRVQGLLRTSGSFDELYWDLTGSSMPLIQAATAMITVPGGAQGVFCSVAPPGLTGDCASSEVAADGSARFSADAIPTGELMTASVKINPGLIANNTPLQVENADVASARAGLVTLGGSLAAAAAVPFIGWWYLRRRNVDYRFEGLPPGLVPAPGVAGHEVRNDAKLEIPVSFAPPPLALAEAGLLLDGQVEVRDTTATLVGLAVAGAVALRSDTDPEVRLLDKAKAPDGASRALLKSLFPKGTKPGETVSLGTPGTLTEAHEKVGEVALEAARAGSWFAREPGRSAGVGLGGLFFPLVMVVIFGASFAGALVLLVLPLLISAVVTWAVVRSKLKRGQRSGVGRAWTDQVEGFRTYLATAEADQLRFEEGEDIFSKYLPWAIMFDLTERWTRVCQELVSLGRLADTAPTWYYGSTWDLQTINWQLNSLDHQVGSAVAAAAPAVADTGFGSSGSAFSSGGGFSGGGFSGGGGGGGGGGSW